MLRRTMLFCPANNKKYISSILRYPADCIIFDFEDSIIDSEKSNAREILRREIQPSHFEGRELYVRVNGLNTAYIEKDIDEVVAMGIRNIRLPMCECKEDILKAAQILSHYEKIHHIPEGAMRIQASIETPKGVINASEIALASQRVSSLSFGTEDYTSALGVERTDDPMQFVYARSHIVLCAHAAGMGAIDAVYANVKNMEGFIKETQAAKRLGFIGKSCIHPNQVKAAHKIFAPSPEQIEQAEQILEASRLAEMKGHGVAMFGGKMIDKPIIERARKILEQAQESENKEDEL